MRRLSGWVLGGFVIAAAVGAAWAQDSDTKAAAHSDETTATVASRRAPDAPYMSDPKFQKAYADAKAPGRMLVDERLARWKKANKVAENRCVECLHEMIRWQMHKNEWKDVVTSATQLESVATEPKDKAYADIERGAALLHFNDGKPKPDALRDADASLRAGLQIAPHATVALYGEGRVLAMMGRDVEAKEMFQKYVDLTGLSDRLHTRAEHFVENPHMAAMPMAPPFTVTTSDGEELSLDDMGGKVVLLDFWATWCGPCKESLPEVQRIALEFKNDPFVVISISGDRNEEEWKKFVASHNMTWPQYRDVNGQLSLAYGVNSIPRYFTIDTDGVLQSVKVGSGADVASDLRRLVKRAREAEKKKALASESHSGN